ncbi:MAG: lysophospholipid acyltransferase family protein [Verrucomicrobia bacterium]|nr:lysophospholipid acyltransferase family protein [Verrucomicrobiota bacterium]
MSWIDDWVAGLARRLVRLGLGIYFRRIERFNAERVPLTGPVLFASNHPGSITDAFLIGTALKRRVGFVGTVQLFRWQPLARLLKACGIIPVNRVKDDPRAMRTVLETFEACYRVLEAGGAVGIFPEGVTYNDSLMRPMKSGTARMALELEQRHGGQLGLWIVPVGISYSGKERYRSEVLLRFGEPIRVRGWLGDPGTSRKTAIQGLSDEIARRIRSLILQLPELAQARLVKAVAGLYLERLRSAERRSWTQAEELASTQRIAEWVEYFRRNEPDRVAAFAARLERYQQHLKRLSLEDPMVGAMSRSGLAGLVLSPVRGAMAILGLPIAVYGWVHRLLPAWVVGWVVRRYTIKGARKAQTPHVTLLAGAVVFGGAYLMYAGMAHWIWGWPVSLVYALSLPLAGLFAHAYLRWMGSVPLWIRGQMLRFRAPWLVWRLQREREHLIREIEAARIEIPGTG